MRVRVLMVGVLVLAGVLACSDEPGTLPPVTATPPSPSSSPAPTPTGIDAPTPEGAGAFARYWFEQLNVAARTGDTAELKSLSADECESCRLFAESIEQLYETGGRIEGGVFSLRAAEAPGLEDPQRARVTVVYDVTATRQVGADGSTLRETDALTGVAGEMGLRRDDDGWIAASLVIQ